MVVVDPKRTGVKARKIDEFVFDAEPGWMMPTTMGDEGKTTGFTIACPGCGVWGAMSFVAYDGFTNPWRVTGGSVEDVTTLSVMNSLLMHCCGWHGFLKNGIFESC